MLMETHFGRGVVAIFPNDPQNPTRDEIDADKTFSNMAKQLSTGAGFPRAGRDSTSVIRALLRIISIVDSDLRHVITTRTRNVMEVTAGTSMCLDLLGQVSSTFIHEYSLFSNHPPL